MTHNEPELPLPSPPSEEDVYQWLLAHPDFLMNQPDLLLALTPPQARRGDAVEDFQFHMLERLQARQKELKDDLEELIGVTRDNISTQEQVQRAVLAAMKPPSLQKFLQAITDDFPTLFNVDVVRLAIETPLAAEFATQFSEHNYSGITALPPKAVDHAIGVGMQSASILETRDGFPETAKQVFDACSGLIRSCILLRITLPQTERHGILAFGVRYAGRFHEGQSAALLHFLAQVVALRLEPLMLREGIEEF